MEGLSDCFAELTDPRCSGGGRHQLLEILMISLCTVLGGGQTAVDMQLFGEAKQSFFRTFLELKNGTPSHDTFSKIFRRLDPDELRGCFQKFMLRFGESCSGVIAIDGKALRRSFDAASTRSGLHMVSAWSCDQRMVLAQIATDAKTREIAAMPKLLDMLSLPGTIVTADALNCTHELARQIVIRGGDYALTVKGNHGAFCADVRRIFEEARPEGTSSYTTVDGDHGRFETRTATVSTAIDSLQRYEWPGLAAIGRINRTREASVRGVTRRTTETSHYVLSSALSPERLAATVRSHWGIENRLHWALDVVMHEDQSRSRMDNSPYNLAILRHMALNLMRKDTSVGSLRAKFNLAGWSNEFLAKLLAQA
jgi:predicted transposase YbfD/YdcC